jgi:hypothetical protein
LNASINMIDSPRICAQPSRLDRRVYEQVEHAAVDALARCSNVRGIFRMGSIHEPGISDLDLIVVAAADRPPDGIADVWNTHPCAQYVMMHSPFLVDERTFHRIGFLAGVSNLELLAGNVLMPALEEIPAVVRLHLAAKYALDGLLFQCRQVALGTLRVRSTLCGLNTVAHLADLIHADVAVPPAATALAGAIQRLRNAWFTNPDVTRLWNLVSEAIPAYLGILDALGAASPMSAEPGTRVLSWMNMRVAALSKEAAEVSVTVPWLSWLADRNPYRNRHLDDLRWMLRTCIVGVTPRTGGLLCPESAVQCPSAIRERAELLRRYAQWHMSASTSLGMLCPIVDVPEPSGLKWVALSGARRWLS